MSPFPEAGKTVHGTAIVLEGCGVLIRGASGAGKSLLALALLEAWQSRGGSALLVADDGVRLSLADGAILMRTPPNIAGLIELRGRGIVERPHVTEARLDLVVDLVPDYERMPEESAFATTLGGVEVARCPVPQAGLVPLWHQMLLIKEALPAKPGKKPPTRQKDT